MYTGIQKAAMLLLIIISLNSKAQAPGYMGRKFTAGYGIYASPAPLAFLIGYGKSPLNVTNELFLEAAVAKKVSLGLSTRFYKTSYGNTRAVAANGDVNSSTFKQFDEHPTGATSIKSRDYYFYAKFFKRNYVAPWGKYFTLGLAVYNYVSSYNPDEMYVRVDKRSYGSNGMITERSLLSDFGPEKQKFTNVDLMLGWGRSRILADRIVIDYGCNFNLAGVALMVFDAFDDPVSDDTTYPTEYIKSTSASRIRGINRFNLHFKIGFLF